MDDPRPGLPRLGVFLGARPPVLLLLRDVSLPESQELPRCGVSRSPTRRSGPQISDGHSAPSLTPHPPRGLSCSGRAGWPLSAPAFTSSGHRAALTAPCLQPLLTRCTQGLPRAFPRILGKDRRGRHDRPGDVKRGRAGLLRAPPPAAPWLRLAAGSQCGFPGECAVGSCLCACFHAS